MKNKLKQILIEARRGNVRNVIVLKKRLRKKTGYSEPAKSAEPELTTLSPSFFQQNEPAVTAIPESTDIERGEEILVVPALERQQTMAVAVDREDTERGLGDGPDRDTFLPP